MIKRNKYLTSVEISKLVGFTPDHIRKLIAAGRIPAEKLGHNWLIEKKNINKIKKLRQRFPRKETDSNGKDKR